jgi:CRP/FNR family cyclic AMP-dependent transcriptional regulator
MSEISQSQSPATLQIFPSGAVLIPQGGKLGTLFVLKSGELEIVRDGSLIRTISQPGSVVGEMSVLLDIPHSATVKAVTLVEAYAIGNALAFLEVRPTWTLQLARMLAQRLHDTTAALVASQNKAIGYEDMVAPDSMMRLLGDPAM